MRSGALSGSPEAQDSLVLGGEGEQFSLIASDGTTLRCSRKTWTHLLTETLEQDHLVFQDLEGSCQVRRKASSSETGRSMTNTAAQTPEKRAL